MKYHQIKEILFNVSLSVGSNSVKEHTLQAAFFLLHLYSFLLYLIRSNFNDSVYPYKYYHNAQAHIVSQKTGAENLSKTGKAIELTY